jgi:transcriptional regulator with XRE-family HTH domain
LAPKRETALQRWGREFALARDAAGYTQETLAQATHVSRSVIAKWETGERTPKDLEDLARCEDKINTRGMLARLLKEWVSREISPEWFEWREVEEDATELLTYQTVLIHGLLQCASYARAILPSEELVQERLERQQQVLGSENPPVFEALLDEGVLYRKVESPEIMIEALTHLIEMASKDEIIVRIVPLTANIKRFAHSFVLAAVNSGKLVAYLDSARKGRIEEAQAEISELRRMWVHFSAEALSQVDSRALIQKAIDDRWSTP